MAEYEKQRSKQIEENKRKMEELGIKSLAYKTKKLMDKTKQKISKIKSKRVRSSDHEYIPDEEAEVDKSIEEDDHEKVENIRSLWLLSKKVMAINGEDLANSVKKPQDSTISMSSLVRMCSEERKKQEQQKKGNERSSMTGIKEFSGQSQPGREVESNISAKMGKSKSSMVAPGSIGVYPGMKEASKEKERLSKQIDFLTKEPIQVRKILPFNRPIWSPKKRQASEHHLFGGGSSCRLDLVDEDEDFEISNDFFLEENEEDQEVIANVDQEEIKNDAAEIENELTHVADPPSEKIVSVEKKKNKGTKYVQRCP